MTTDDPEPRLRQPRESFREDKMCARFLISTIAAMTFGALAAVAQAADERAVPVGGRIRVTAPSVSPDCIEGTLAAVDREALTVVSTDARVKVPRSQITKLEVARGSKSRWASAALIGAGAGVLVGVALSNPPSSAESFQIDGGYVARGAAVGAAFGALVGALLRTDRWMTVPGDKLTVGIGPVRGRGVALAMTVSF